MLIHWHLPPNAVSHLSTVMHSSQLELQVVLIDELFANVEQSEYELFNMGRGPYAGKKAGAIQTNDDAKEEECQTEEVSGAGDGTEGGSQPSSPGAQLVAISSPREECQTDEVCLPSSPSARGRDGCFPSVSIRGGSDVNPRKMQIELQPYASQAPEDRNAMTDVEVTAGSITAGVYQEATASSSTSSSSAAAGRSAAAMRITQMEAGMELKLAAFVQWAGPMVLAALGISPSG